MSISNAMSMVAGFFRLGNLVPDYSCADEGNAWTLEAATVKKNSTFACLMVRNCTELSTKNHWYSMYEEFEWVCEKDHFRATMQSLFPIGVFFGFMISGHISDYFGRKWIMFIGEVYSLISGLICAWSPSFSVYLWISAVGSLIGPIGASASFSLIVESVNPKYRLLQGFSFQYSIGLMLAGILANYTQHWRYHLTIANLVSLPALFMILKLEESPRFLLQKQKFVEAAAVMTRIAKFNGFKDVKFTAKEMKQIHKNHQNLEKNSQEQIKTEKRYTSLDLFANWKMTSYAIAQMLTGITMNIVNDVLFYNIQDLSGSPFMNTFLMGALRLWTPFAAFALENGTKTIGRWKLLVFSQGAVCLLFSFMFFIDLFGLNSSLLRSIGTGSVLIGYTLESGLVWIAYKLYTTELFPTCIRSIALSTFSCVSMIGSMATPQLTYISRFWHPAPYSGAALLAGLSTTFAIMFLPETHFVALPDTIKEAANRKTLYKETNSEAFLPLSQQEKKKSTGENKP
uniref:Major facilitator superfamily (MFS) profile domain-containing protein n=1 Tax=Panagrolaimus superbus TaxID=310955 RepID=A0A914Y0H5_9BILA